MSASAERTAPPVHTHEHEHAHADGYKESPTIGSLPLLGILPQLLHRPIEYLLGVARAHPDAIPKLKLGPVSTYLVYHPAHVEHVLSTNWRNYTKQGSRGSMWRPINRLLGEGLVTSEGDVWLRQRRLLQPLFSPKNIAELTEQMTPVILAHLRRFDDAVESGRPLNLSREMVQLSQRVLMRAMFSEDADAAAIDALEHAIMSGLSMLNLRMFLFFLPEWRLIPGERGFVEMIRSIDAHIYPLLSKWRSRGAPRTDVVSRLLSARDGDQAADLSDRELRDQVVNLMVAGSDTTSLTLSWMWHLLEEHPHVEQRFRAEIDTVLHGRTPTYADLEKLTYTRMILQEVMRLYPPAWVLPRVVAEDDVVGGYRLPAGAPLLLCLLASHRDPRVFPDPDRFDPERFDPARRGPPRPRYAYYPFGGGARQCIGMHLSLAEATLIAALVAQRYRLRRVPGTIVRPHSATTLRPKWDLQVHVTPA